MKIVADSQIPFLDEGMAKLPSGHEIVYLPGSKISRRDLLDAEALIVRTRTKCDEKLLRGTKVRFIASATIGYDHIDTDYCESRNIFWTNALGCNSSSVMQYIASALLNIAVKHKFLMSEKTIGIVGVGNVGSKVAKIAELFGMKILLNDPPRERLEGEKNFVPLERIKQEADIITFHVPLIYEGTDRTYHMVDKNFLSSVKKNVWIFNSSRGEIVETEELKKKLKGGGISGAVIDVWENEPDIDREFLSLANFATPHIAGYSTDGKANGTSMSIRALSRFFKLGINNWYPEKVPVPKNTKIKIDCEGKTKEEVLLEAVKQTYDIEQDDSKLRNAPEKFEKFRGEYPLRREFPVYSVELLNDNAKFAELLKKMGFNS